MACNCGGRSLIVVWENVRQDGTAKRYLTEREARSDNDAHGGQVSQVTHRAH